MICLVLFVPAFRTQSLEIYVDVVAGKARWGVQGRHIEGNVENPVAFAAHEMSVRGPAGGVVSG